MCICFSGCYDLTCIALPFGSLLCEPGVVFLHHVLLAYAAPSPEPTVRHARVACWKRPLARRSRSTQHSRWLRDGVRPSLFSCHHDGPVLTITAWPLFLLPFSHGEFWCMWPTHCIPYLFSPSTSYCHMRLVSLSFVRFIDYDVIAFQMSFFYFLVPSSH